MKDVFASPLFPRLLNGDLIRDTIAKGVRDSILTYVGKAADWKDEPFLFGTSMIAFEVEISDEVFVITAEVAEAYRQALSKPPEPVGARTLFGVKEAPLDLASGERPVVRRRPRLNSATKRC